MLGATVVAPEVKRRRILTCLPCRSLTKAGHVVVARRRKPRSRASYCEWSERAERHGGKAAIDSGRAERERTRYNGANGMRDPPPLRLRRGRHKRVRAELEFLRSERCGQRAS